MTIVADAQGVERLIRELAEQIRSYREPLPRPSDGVALIGIRRRGDALAARLAQHLGIIDVGAMDITLYRDDLSETGASAKVGGTSIPFDVEGRDVVLVDDVVMTGRSVMAALREILDFGRPARIRLAVLVARPERELPIQPEHAAVRLSPGPTEKIDVRLRPQDDRDQITINSRAPAQPA